MIKIIEDLRPDFDPLSLQGILENMKDEPFERKCLVGIAWGIGYAAGIEEATKRTDSHKAK